MSSPFASQFNTNYCPTDEEVAQIKTLLVEPRVRLRDLDERIEKLQEERDKVAAHIAAHEALISPIRRIPLDILQELFLACLPSDRNCAMASSEPPLQLGRVCSHWRTVVSQFPAMWAKLHIVEPVIASWMTGSVALIKAKAAQRMEVARNWLDRSGYCPLSISFFRSDHEHFLSAASATTPSFLRLLISYVSRWKAIQLSFNLADETLMSELKALVQGCAPMLQEIRLDNPASGMTRRLNWEALAFLRGSSVSICYLIECGDRLHDLPMPWGNLTRLVIQADDHWQSEGLSTRELVQLLSECTQLETCRL
ncbi:hypothetical protein C8F01DRAFT_976980, partial [Mycena amicta]